MKLFEISLLILITGVVHGWSSEGNSIKSKSNWILLPGVSLTYPQIISVPISIIRVGGVRSMTPILQLEPGVGGNKLKIGLGGNPGFKSWSGIFGKVSLLNTWPMLDQEMAAFWGGEIQLSLLYLHFDLGYYTKTPFHTQSTGSLISAAIGFGL